MLTNLYSSQNLSPELHRLFYCLPSISACTWRWAKATHSTPNSWSSSPNRILLWVPPQLMAIPSLWLLRSKSLETFLILFLLLTPTINPPVTPNLTSHHIRYCHSDQATTVHLDYWTSLQMCLLASNPILTPPPALVYEVSYPVKTYQSCHSFD